MEKCVVNPNLDLSLSPTDGRLSISDLPGEILTTILDCLHDTKTLMSCKQVCMIWRDYVDYIVKNPSFWYRSCQHEIPDWVLIDLLDNVFPNHWKDRNVVDWQVIYKCWFGWTALHGSSSSSKKIRSKLNGVSSIKVSGEWILISTCEGRGKLIGQHLDERYETIEIFMGGDAILNLEGVNCAKVPPSGLGRMQNYDRSLTQIFDTLGHNEIWLELKNCYLVLTKVNSWTIDKIQQKVRYYNEYEAKLLEGNLASSVSFSKWGPKKVQSIITRFPGSYKEIVQVWSNKISLSKDEEDGSKKVDTWLMNCAQTSNNTTDNCEGVTEMLYSNIYMPCSNLYSWHGSLFINYSDSRQLTITYKGTAVKQVTPIREGCVSAALFYAAHLFLGTDRGDLFIYHVKDPSDCLSIVVYETPSWNINIGYNKIVRIAIAEPQKNLSSKKPVIICASPEDLHQISFPDSTSAHN